MEGFGLGKGVHVQYRGLIDIGSHHMLKPLHSNARTRNRARRCHQRVLLRRGSAVGASPHALAIRRLSLELQAEECLLCNFHGGVTWRSVQPLLPRGTPVVVDREKPIRIAGRRYIPDLTVRSASSGRLLLLIEVWHTHAVSDRKRRAFSESGLCWIEVQSWHVLGRCRSRPLPVVDWGGAGLPDAPNQGQLFAPASDATLGGPRISRPDSMEARPNVLCGTSESRRWLTQSDFTNTCARRIKSVTPHSASSTSFSASTARPNSTASNCRSGSSNWGGGEAPTGKEGLGWLGSVLV